MIPWLLRASACAVIVGATACASAAQSQRTFRPNEVQVVEPEGHEDQWTYAPRALTVMPGAVVTFVNRGKQFHTVTSDDAGRPFDLSIDTNKTGTITFAKLGTFAYHCGVHPQMKGVVKVCDGACPQQTD